MGVPINGKALLTPEVTEQGTETIDPNAVNPEDTTTPDAPKVLGDPKNTVVNFLSSLNSQNLKAHTAKLKTQVGEVMTAL